MEKKVNVSEMEGAPIVGAVLKRNTDFVNVRKEMIAKYGNYYPVGATEKEIISWCDAELEKLGNFVVNIQDLKTKTQYSIEDKRLALIKDFAAGLSDDEKEKLKTII